MRQFSKWALRIITVLVVIGAGLAAYNWERLVRLYNINNLFAEANIVQNFSHMKDIFFWAPIPENGTKPAGSDWPETLSAMPETYVFDGKKGNINQRLEQFSTTSLLVLHKGEIVHEEYFHGTKKEDRRVSWSMAKSVLSAMFGIAISEGKIANIEDPVTKYVEVLKGTAYAGISIQDVLHMASGVKFNEDYLDFNSDIKRMGRVLALGGSMDEFAASIKERERESGLKRQYTSIDTHVLGMVLRAATGKSLMEYLAEKIWSKMSSGESSYYLTDGYGVAFALGGLNMRTRDYARFGQLFLNKGKWEGQQIVPELWVEQSTTVSAPRSSIDEDELQYGFQWWMPPATDDEYFAVGIYGQYIYINPKAEIVVVKTAANRDFRADGQNGRTIKVENIAIFRAIAEHYSDWRYPKN
ncbi:MAG: serine hydrolase [Rhizobiaceae bacterium]|nr:serine hydrolase [Rhizobiaceae bacterium]